MKLGIDMDGCLADFNTAFYALLLAKFGARDTPVGYIPTQPPCWQWPRHLGYTEAEELSVWQDVWQSPTFWQYLGEEAHASETVTLLDKLAFLGHDVYFITHRKGVKVKLQTERWLEARGMYNPTVLVCEGDKVPLYGALGLTAAVDDKLETLNAACSIPNLRIYAKNCLHNLGRDRRWGILGVDSVLAALKKELILNRIDLTYKESNEGRTVQASTTGYGPSIFAD